jgi:hypothetical protein
LYSIIDVIKGDLLTASVENKLEIDCDGLIITSCMYVTYIHISHAPARRDSGDITLTPENSYFSKMTAMRNTADVTGGQPLAV